MRNLRAFGAQDEGASALEFSIMIIPVLLLILGAFEYGRLLWTRQSLQSVATTMARCIGVLQAECSTSGIYDAAKSNARAVTEAAKLGVTLRSTDVALNASATCQGVTGFATVTISYSFDSAVPNLVTAFAGGTTLRASACFPIQS